MGRPTTISTDVWSIVVPMLDFQTAMTLGRVSHSTRATVKQAIVRKAWVCSGKGCHQPVYLFCRNCGWPRCYNHIRKRHHTCFSAAGVVDGVNCGLCGICGQMGRLEWREGLLVCQAHKSMDSITTNLVMACLALLCMMGSISIISYLAFK